MVMGANIDSDEFIKVLRWHYLTGRASNPEHKDLQKHLDKAIEVYPFIDKRKLIKTKKLIKK